MPMKQIKVDADRKNMQTVLDFVIGELEAKDWCDRKDILPFHMVIDEIFGNIADYAYVDDKKGTVIVAVDTDEEKHTVELVFSDDGRAFDTLNNDDPDVNIPVEKRKVGGLGIFMVKNAMDEISYEYIDERNVLRMKKKIGGSNA